MLQSCAHGQWAGLTVVERDGVQTVEQLPLVLVDPLHLHVKDGVRVHFHMAPLLQEGGELQLVLLKQGRTDSRQQVDARTEVSPTCPSLPV